MQTTKEVSLELQFLGSEPLAKLVRDILGIHYDPYIEAIEASNCGKLVDLLYSDERPLIIASNCLCAYSSEMRGWAYTRFWKLKHQAIPVCNELVWRKIVTCGMQETLLARVRRNIQNDGENAELHRRIASFIMRSSEDWFAVPGTSAYVPHRSD